MSEDPGTRQLRVSSENLNRAIEVLRALGGLERYPEAHQALVLERSRRELRAPPNDILLTREAFEGLPSDVQALLTAEPDPDAE
jgi:hypothetical protein